MVYPRECRMSSMSEGGSRVINPYFSEDLLEPFHIVICPSQQCKISIRGRFPDKEATPCFDLHDRTARLLTSP